jgi:hypothetical protein
MSASLRLPQIAIWTMVLLATIAWWLFRPSGLEGAHAWLANELPWLARLLDRYLVLFSLAVCWAAWRKPRIPPGALAVGHFCTALLALTLPMNLVLGLLLGLLTAVALVARPWPNRVIIGRCIVLGGLAIAIDAVAH